MSLTEGSNSAEGAPRESRKEVTIKTGDLRDDYHLKDEVGRGRFGVVHKVICKEDNCIYAAKFIKVAQAKRNDVFREIEIMKKLDHDNLIKLTDVYDMQTRIVVIMEFISGGELFERVVEEDSLTESEAAIYMRQILDGLQHMHGKNIIHLDLKPENVVCVQPGSTNVKLIDFGLARQLEHGKETKIACGTPEFVAPEVLNYDPVTLASDMWSVGVIAYILLSGLSPFLGDTDPETFANVTACEWDFDDESFDDVSNESKDFIEGLLIHNPRDRRTVDLCLEHDWIQSHSYKKRKKLKVDNLRKFLAKKRWQKSVNAVRAVRRLSSFGASLLGKSGSLLRDRKEQGSMESPELSIAEDSEEGNGEEEQTAGESIQENNEAKSQMKLPDSGNKTEQQQSVAKERVFLKKLSDNDSLRSLANISQLRKKFEILSNASAPPKPARNEASASEKRPRSNSLDWDYRTEESESESRDGRFNEGPAARNEIFRGKDGFFKSKTIERSSKLVGEATRALGHLSQSTDSLLSNCRLGKISLEKGNRTKGRNDEMLKSNIETLRDRKKLLNEGVSSKEKDVNFKTEMPSRTEVLENGTRRSDGSQSDLLTARKLSVERKSLENLEEELARRKEVEPSAKKTLANANHQVAVQREECDRSKMSLNVNKQRRSNDLSIDNEIVESVKRPIANERREFARELLAKRMEREKKCKIKDKGEHSDGSILASKTVAASKNSERNLRGKTPGHESDLLANKTKIDLLLDKDQERGCRNKEDVDNEKRHKYNEPLSDNRAKVSRRHNNNAEFTSDSVSAVRTIGSTVSKDSKSNSAGSSGAIATKQSIQKGLEYTAKESKQTDFYGDYNMPHKRSWFKSSAAAKRASFKELLSKSIAAEEGEDDDNDTGDEEPIHIEVKKEKFEDFFEDIEEIGRGRFGIVSKVKEKSTGKFYAAKYIKVRAATRAIVRQEIDLLCEVRHRRIVKLYDVFEESRRFILVLEWVAGGELFEKLSREEIISEKEVVFFIKQILQGVRCMHKKGILHLDLKPENVMLVDPNSTEIKIIDFGLAKRYSPKEEIKVLSGTPAFAAPEIINFEKITTATDMWSIGVIAYVLMSGLSPFAGDDNQETCSNVTKAIWDFDDAAFETISPEAKDFISKLMVRNSRQRMSIEECMQHPWIKSAKKRKKSVIKTKKLFRFTKSFSRSIDQLEQDSDEATSPIPMTSSNVADLREGDAIVNENPDDKASKQPIFQVINTMDESSTDIPSTPGIPDTAKSMEEYKILEDRYKSMERDYNNIKVRLRKQVELHNEIESLRNELEKSLQAHKRLQDSLLIHEEEKAKISEAHQEMKEKVLQAEKQNKELVQKLDIVNDNYEKIGRKYKRLQEKLEKNEDLEDRIEELERTKARKNDKIKELEEVLSEVREKNRKAPKGDNSVKMKLDKENRSLQNTVDQCHQEIEELEDRLGSLEAENLKLQSQLKQLRSSHQVDNNNKVDDAMAETLKKLEALRVDLEEQIAIEVRDRKLAEKERDTIEEEFAEERANLESRIQRVLEHNNKLEEEIREVTALLEASKKSFFQLDEEFQDLKKDKGAEKRQHLLEVKLKEEEISELKKEKESLEVECRRLDKKMAESIEEIKKLESEKLSREAHVNTERRPHGGNKELERVKEDLRMTQDYLRIATDTNSLLQLEVKKLKKDHETELNIQLIELEAKLTKAHEAEIAKIREELNTVPNSERKELEDRITVQDFAIRKLQAILEAREDEERQKNDTQEIIPIVMNGKQDSSPLESPRSKITIADSIKVTISPGSRINVASSVDNEIEDDADDRDTLTDRELRRIAYKLADGVWNNMGQALCLRGPKYEEIMGSSYNDQEKVFRLLTLWKSEMKQPRPVMISQLAVAAERMKRREMVKFIKELNGREGSGMSIRKRIRNFVR